MAKATRHIHHNEEHYVAKMNFRSEKILHSQIDRLNKEKLLHVKSLNAQMRSYQRKLQKINDRVLEVERLSQNSVDPAQRLPTREHFSKLSSDAVRQRHMITGAGYSYIDQLLGVSKPLVDRPLRWGINPSISNLQRESFKPLSLGTDDAASSTFVTEIKGQPIYLRPREAVYIKRQKPTSLVLPPIALNVNRKEAKQPPQDSLRTEVKNRNDIENVTNQDENFQLSPIPEGEFEETVQTPKGIKEKKRGTEMDEKRDGFAENGVASKASEKEFNLEIALQISEPLLDEAIPSRDSVSSLRGHFITEYELPPHGMEQFTRSNKTLNSEREDLGNKHPGKEKNSTRYQLHSRRFSL